MTLTLSLVGHLEVLGQIKLWSPVTLKRNRGAVLRFGKFLGRAGDAGDLTEETIDRYAEQMTAAVLADWTVAHDAIVLRTLAKHAGALISPPALSRADGAARGRAGFTYHSRHRHGSRFSKKGPNLSDSRLAVGCRRVLRPQLEWTATVANQRDGQIA